MDKDNLLISKANFVEFRKDNIIDQYEFHPRVKNNIKQGIRKRSLWDCLQG